MRIIAIVVAYNGMEWYKKCFDSLKYSSVPVEIIVIDNQSSDNTVSFIKDNYPEIYLIENKENLGFGKANNIGFRYAIEQHADFVFLLNQDAWVKSNTIEVLINKMKQNQEYGILSPIHLAGNENEIDRNFLSYISANELMSDLVIKGGTDDKIYEVDFVNAALWLVSSKCLQVIGGFNPIFPHYGEDEDYVNRLRIHGFKIGICSHTFGVHDRPQSEGAKTFKQKRSRYYVAQLIPLANLSFKFSKALYYVMLNIIVDMIKSVFLLDIKNIYISISTAFKVVYGIPNIIDKRKQTRLTGATFLK